MALKENSLTAIKSSSYETNLQWQYIILISINKFQFELEISN